MSKDGKPRASHHLNVDPNDPRNVPPAKALPVLSDVPEAAVKLPEVVVSVEGATTTRVGLDPNDPRVR